MRWAGSVAVAFFVVSGSVLSSCSSAPGSNGEVNKSAPAVLSDALAAMNGATSFRYHGVNSLVSGAETFDLTYSKSRSGGTISEPGATLQVVIGGGTIYLRASLKSWETLLNNPSKAQQIANKWIKVPSNGSFSGLAELGSKAKFVQSLKFAGSVHKQGGTGTVPFHGQTTLILVGPSGSELYVAATGTPYVVGLSNSPSAKGGASVGEISEFNSATPPPIPTGAINLTG